LIYIAVIINIMNIIDEAVEKNDSIEFDE